MNVPASLASMKEYVLMVLTLTPVPVLLDTMETSAKTVSFTNCLHILRTVVAYLLFYKDFQEVSMNKSYIRSPL